MKLHVEVTAEDIAAGEQDSCERCPIALAILRVTDSEYVRVEYERIWLDRTLCTPPKKARDFMSAFDDGKTVKPFSFTIDSGAEASP